MTRVEPNGPSPCDLAIVGESPGKQEVKEGRGFCGPSGKMLWAVNGVGDDLIGTIMGRPRDTCWVTNVCKVPLPEEEWLALDSSNQQVHINELSSELRRVQPKVVLAFGARANKVLYPGFTSMTDCQGKIVYSREGYAVVPLWHPAYVLRGNPEAKLDIIASLSEACDLIGHIDEVRDTVGSIPVSLYGHANIEFPGTISFMSLTRKKKGKCVYCGETKECGQYDGLGLRWLICLEHSIRTAGWAETNVGKQSIEEQVKYIYDGKRLTVLRKNANSMQAQLDRI